MAIKTVETVINSNFKVNGKTTLKDTALDGSLEVGKDLEVDGKLTLNSADDLELKDGTTLETQLEGKQDKGDYVTKAELTKGFTVSIEEQGYFDDIVSRHVLISFTDANNDTIDISRSGGTINNVIAITIGPNTPYVFNYGCVFDINNNNLYGSSDGDSTTGAQSATLILLADLELGTPE